MWLGLVSALGACAGEQLTGAGPAEHRQGDTSTDSRSERDRLGNPTARLTGPVPNGNAAGCVERYSPAAVANRAFAFDGVVVDMGPATSNRGDGSDLDLAGVTFEVREWFSGGRGATVTVDMPPSEAEAHRAAHGAPPYGVGSRLLVSGEPRWGGTAFADAIAWGCGFTRYYDPKTADSWSQVLSGRR